MVVEAIDGVMRRIRRLEALEYSRSKSDGNILTNPGFEIWQRGTGPFIANGYTADRWYINGTGATTSVAPNVTVPDGSLLSARVVFTPGASTAARLYQYIENGDQYHGLTVGFTAKVNASVANNARLFIKDNAVYEYSQYHSGVAGWEDLSVARLLSAGISSLSFGLELGPLACTVYIDNSCVMVGTVALFTPRHPSDDWDRCLRYYETGHLCWRGYTPDDHGIWLPLTFVERKCEVPTITMSGGVYDVYGTVLSDTLVAQDENTACWQLSSTGVGIGEVADRHWIAEANCEPSGRVLYFSPGNPADWYGDGPYSTGELWKYDGTTCTFVFKEDPALSPYGENWITCIFWSQIYNTMYFCTFDWDEEWIRVYSINTIDDTVVKVAEVLGAGSCFFMNPIVDAAEFQGNIYLLTGGVEYSDPGENCNQILLFNPVAGTLTSVLNMPMAPPPADPFAYTGGIAVDPVRDQLVAFDGYEVYYSTDGSVWSLDVDLRTGIFDVYDSGGLITYNNKIYAGVNSQCAMHGPGQATVLRRNGPGDWEIEYTGPYDCDTDVNGICAFTAMYDEVTGAETGLAGVFWAWFCAGSGVAIRANDGTWGIDWVGPPILSDPTGHQQGFWAQSLAQYNGDLYCLFGDRIEWYNVGLYKRTGVGTWELVQQFNNYYPAYTNHSTLAIAASNNTLKKCHEV